MSTRNFWCPATVLFIFIALAIILLLSSTNGQAWAQNALQSGTLPLTNIKQITAGFDHTCALTNSGSVKCWGRNDFGQLGDGTTTTRLLPVNVVGLSSGVIQISAYGLYTCALTNVGNVKCWGLNREGELGDGTTTDRFTPVDVVGLSSGISQVSAGYLHTCVLTSMGGVKCWGFNGNGELGDGTQTDHYIPDYVVGLSSGITQLAAGYYHSCAVIETARVQCWGSNAVGELGDGTTTTRLTPVDVAGLSSGISQVSAGHYSTCALTGTGGLKCWGWNYNGELGDGTNIQRNTPVDVFGLSSEVIQSAAGTDHTCALMSAGGVKCWGDNLYGELGDGTNTNQYTPVNVDGLSDRVIEIVASGLHTCALMSAGDVKCWGKNNLGQLGDGTDINRNSPVDVLETGTTEPTPTETSTQTSTPFVTSTSIPTLTPTPTTTPSPTIPTPSLPPTPSSSPTNTPAPIDTIPPPVPDGRVFTCTYSNSTGGQNYYKVNYTWNAVSDIGTAGMHQYPYWSQVSAKADFSVVPQPGWYNSWDNKLERTSDISFVENTTLYAHVRSRDAKDNQSSWSAASQLVLNVSNCANEGMDIIYQLPNFGESGKPLNQTDPRWAGEPYGWDSNTDRRNNGYTIGNYGCNMTVGAMIANYYARLQDRQFHTDPNDLNTWLRANDGYKEAMTKQSSIIAYANRSGVQYGFDSDLQEQLLYLDDNNNVFTSDADADAFVARTKQKVNIAIKADEPVMVGVKSSSGIGHFVVLTGIARVNGVDTWLVHDPLRNEVTTLKQVYSNRYYNILGFKSSVVTSSLNVVIPITQNASRRSAKITDALNSIEFILTDPLGRRTGMLPNQQGVQEIPEAIYGLDSLTPINGGTGHQWIALTVENPIKGAYTLAIAGSGTYQLAMDSTDSTGLYSQAETAVSLTPGLTAAYVISYTSGTPTVVTSLYFVHLPLVMR